MITIRTEKESITLKLTEEESQKTFWEIVSILKEGKSLGGGYNPPGSSRSNTG